LSVLLGFATLTPTYTRRKNIYVEKSRDILDRQSIRIDSASNGARLWGTHPSQTSNPNHPGVAAAQAAGTYHAGYVHSKESDKMIYKILKGVEKRGGNVEEALKDIGQRMESGSWALNGCPK
jgi:hypothetical protein